MKSLSGSTPRILISAALLGLGLVGVVYRLFNLQVLEAAELARRAERQHQKSVAMEGERGTIYDRNGKILATNVEVPSIYAVPAQIQDPHGAASRLARLLGGDPTHILKRFEGKKNFVWIERKVSPATAARVKGAGIDGVGILSESQRFYPKRYLLGHILGFAGVDNRGLEGVELKYDKELRGEKGWVVVERDAFGQSIFPKGLNYIAPARGKDIVLTIDEVIQHVVENELDAALEETSAAGGSVIVMDPKSGEILAMTVRPQFNPNRAQRQDPEQWRNRAITDPYEPGSTFKIVTASAALQEGAASLLDIYDCEDGKMAISGGMIRDAEKHRFLTFPEVIQKSSNVGTVKIAMQVGEKSFYRQLRAFGFGERTGIDLLGESPGLIKDPRSWSGRSLASIAIGYEIGATPIQIITAAAAIANGGWVMRPHLVSEMRDPASGEVTRKSPEILRRAVSRETSQKILEILEGAVSKNGTGARAALTGYRVAGKTGTSRKIDPVTRQYSAQEAVSSFVGIVPVEDPRLVILVVVDNPKGASWGGTVAAPVFRNIVEQVLRHLGVTPRTQERILLTAAR